MTLLPQYWEEKPLGNIANILTGYPFDANLFNGRIGFPVLRIRDVKLGKTNTFYDGKYDDTFIVRRGDFLIGMDVEKTTVEDIGVPSIVNPANNAWITTPTTVTCWLKNNGMQAETNVGVHYKMLGGTQVDQTYSH